MKRAKGPSLEELMTERVIQKLAWRAKLRAREIRAEAREVWQDKRKNAALKYRAAQFEDLSVMLRELQDPEKASDAPNVDLMLGVAPPPTDPGDV
jgi:hypothetical protein